MAGLTMTLLLLGANQVQGRFAFLRSLAYVLVLFHIYSGQALGYRSGRVRPRSGVQVIRRGPTQPITARPRNGSSAGFQGARVKVSSRRMSASRPVGVTIARS